jgi:hypothetical protein
VRLDRMADGPMIHVTHVEQIELLPDGAGTAPQTPQEPQNRTVPTARPAEGMALQTQNIKPGKRRALASHDCWGPLYAARVRASASAASLA